MRALRITPALSGFSVVQCLSGFGSPARAIAARATISLDPPDPGTRLQLAAGATVTYLHCLIVLRSGKSPLIASIWATSLTELQRQMAALTFDQWLLRSRAVDFDGDTLVVEVASEPAVSWLESRLRPTVERTVGRVAGQDLGVRLVVADQTAAPARARRQVPDRVEPPEPVAVPAFVAPSYNVHEAGWFPVSEYECRFWAPLLGRIGWPVWEIVRRADRERRRATGRRPGAGRRRLWRRWSPAAGSPSRAWSASAHPKCAGPGAIRMVSGGFASPGPLIGLLWRASLRWTSGESAGTSRTGSASA